MKNITKKLAFIVAIFSVQIAFSQVGIGITSPRGALDVSSTTQGIVPPAVALTDLTIQAPVVNPQGGAIPAGTFVWNTNTEGSIPTNVSPGLYYWNGTRWISIAGSPGGLDWSIVGNGGIDGGVTGVTGTPAALGANFIGTYDNTNFDIKTNGLLAARVSSLGEFFIGAIETVLPGDLMNGVSEGNAAFPWAINGYTDQNGSGVYGRVSGGTTNYAAIQGEYKGTGTKSAGVRGIAGSKIGGTGTKAFVSGVKGELFFNGGNYSAQDYAFALAGSTLSNSGNIVGGAYGLNAKNGRYGILGYKRSNGGNVAVLGSGDYKNLSYRIEGGDNNIDTSVGLAIDGGFLGGHIKGNQIGLITKGKLVGQYTDGSNISNKGFAVLNKNQNGNKTITYVPTSTTVDVSTKGMGKLVNGKAFINFDDNYSDLITADKPIIVTVSPMGETNGVYVAEVTKNGFIIKENNNGTSSVNFYWIAIGEKHDASNLEVPKSMMANDFDENLNSYLTINEDAKGENISKAMWWNGTSFEFGKIAPDELEDINRQLSNESNERKGERVAPRKYYRESQNK